MLLPWLYYVEAIFNFKGPPPNVNELISKAMREKFDISTLSMFYNSMNLIKINITVTGSHVECHTYSKWPSSNNKMYIKGISTFTVIMLTETTYYIWLNKLQIHMQSTNINTNSASTPCHISSMYKYKCCLMLYMLKTVVHDN